MSNTEQKHTPEAVAAKVVRALLKASPSKTKKKASISGILKKKKIKTR